MKLYYLALLLCFCSSIFCENSAELEESLKQHRIQQIAIQLDATATSLNQVATEILQECKQKIECLEESNFGKPECEKTRLEIVDDIKECLKESNSEDAACKIIRHEFWNFIKSVSQKVTQEKIETIDLKPYIEKHLEKNFYFIEKVKEHNKQHYRK